MIVELNYQPEPPSNQSEDIDDGMSLTERDLLKQLHHDLLEAIPEVTRFEGDFGSEKFCDLLDRLEDCYSDYIACSKRLEEM